MNGASSSQLCHKTGRYTLCSSFGVSSIFLQIYTNSSQKHQHNWTYYLSLLKIAWIFWLYRFENPSPIRWWFFPNPSQKYARQFGSFPQIAMKIKIFENTTQSHIVNFANSNLQIFGLVVHHRLGCRRRCRDRSRDVGLYPKRSRERLGEICTGISWCLIHRFNWSFTYL